jgi:hypothetical protein
MLREEHTVYMISPPRTRAPYIIRTEALRKISSSYRAADVLDEPAHANKCGTGEIKRKGIVGSPAHITSQRLDTGVFWPEGLVSCESWVSMAAALGGWASS